MSSESKEEEGRYYASKIFYNAARTFLAHYKENRWGLKRFFRDFDIGPILSTSLQAMIFPDKNIIVENLKEEMCELIFGTIAWKSEEYFRLIKPSSSVEEAKTSLTLSREVLRENLYIYICEKLESQLDCEISMDEVINIVDRSQFRSHCETSFDSKLPVHDFEKVCIELYTEISKCLNYCLSIVILKSIKAKEMYRSPKRTFKRLSRFEKSMYINLYIEIYWQYIFQARLKEFEAKNDKNSIRAASYSTCLNVIKCLNPYSINFLDNIASLGFNDGVENIPLVLLKLILNNLLQLKQMYHEISLAFIDNLHEISRNDSILEIICPISRKLNLLLQKIKILKKIKEKDAIYSP